ncbi:MAG: hypothetical protein KKB42_14045 [Gammaproteobacteria bacterium]|nr:hypothetical protein [Gammaproteobacteria bacterium]MBU4172275.1 hypothetical protein [Gammaproteobacteria bacterium]
MTSSTTSQPQKHNRLKDIALFLASPFIGLVYAVLLPGKVLQIALRERKENSKNN